MNINDRKVVYNRPPVVERCFIASIGSMTAAFITNPIDVIKIRMQLERELSAKIPFSKRYYKGLLKGSIQILKDEGIFGLYKGLIPSLYRDGIYGGIRLGLYEPAKELLGAVDSANTPLWKKMIAGASSGMIGSFLVTPADLIKIRMQADQKCLKYISFFKTFGNIYNKEGVKGLWRGVGPTVQRAMILTAAQASSYDHTKHTILNFGILTEGINLHIVSSMTAGFITAFFTSPIDVIKTRIMNQIRENKIYTSTFDCFQKSLRSEGLHGLYKGFFPNWLRIGPHTIISFLVFEQIRVLLNISPI